MIEMFCFWQMKAEIQANHCHFLTVHRQKLIPIKKKICENERYKITIRTLMG